MVPELATVVSGQKSLDHIIGRMEENCIEGGGVSLRGGSIHCMRIKGKRYPDLSKYVLFFRKSHGLEGSRLLRESACRLLVL